MSSNLKEIHIGSLVNKRVKEMDIDASRICSFLKIDAKMLEELYESEHIRTDLLLRMSKLLEYDFFRLYSQHLILYAPPGKADKDPVKTSLPQFRKNIYTKEIIDFMLELLETGEKSKQQIMDDYKIPKTTLYKWISKYKK